MTLRLRARCGLRSVRRGKIGDCALSRSQPYSNAGPYGLLMSYGPDTPDYFRKAAGYADKILHGAKPADLPVEQPTRLKQVINLKVARAMG
jgi:putative ABC transport system substrate-binding protein